ncbi:MAG: hypothetical protein OEM46_12195, partial [Ignavibacteria bacterium]|nr:hypothetical protein [Ignavibacteria bacterium]
MKKQKFLLIVVVLLICSFSVRAQWSIDPTINTPVSTAINKQTEVTICSNWLGGTFMVWRDYRNNPGIFEGDLYAQHLDFSGNPLWTADGIIVNSGSGGQFRPKIISDGTGGAIIVWAKNGGGFYGYDLYAQRIDADGNLLWNPNGVAIAVSNATDTFHEIIPDANGGVIVTWSRLPSFGETDIYAQKVDADGNVLWATNGVAVCVDTLVQAWPQLISDSNGGVIIAWEDGRNGTGTNDIYAQRIDENGIAQWTTDGIPVCADQAFQTQ